MALIVHVINDDKSASFSLGYFAGKEIHACEGRNAANNLFQRLEIEFIAFLGGYYAIIVLITIPPGEPNRAKNKINTKIRGSPIDFPRDNLLLEEIILVRPRR